MHWLPLVDEGGSDGCLDPWPLVLRGKGGPPSPIHLRCQGPFPAGPALPRPQALRMASRAQDCVWEGGGRVVQGFSRVTSHHGTCWDIPSQVSEWPGSGEGSEGRSGPQGAVWGSQAVWAQRCVGAHNCVATRQVWGPWGAGGGAAHLMRGLKTFHRTLMKLVGCTT